MIPMVKSKLKIAGTPFDRRSNTAWKRDEIIAMYNNGYSKREISEKFNISMLQVWRYLNHDKYLEQCRKDTARYCAKNKFGLLKDRALFDLRRKVSNANHREYISYLMNCKYNFEPSMSVEDYIK